VGLERGPLSLVSTIEELLERKSSGSGLENRDYRRRDVTLTTWHHLSAKGSTNFADKRRSLGRNSSRADSGDGDLFIYTRLYGIKREKNSNLKVQHRHNLKSDTVTNL
jgi:hypothetical protein